MPVYTFIKPGEILETQPGQIITEISDHPAFGEYVVCHICQQTHQIDTGWSGRCCECQSVKDHEIRAAAIAAAYFPKFLQKLKEQWAAEDQAEREKTQERQLSLC